MRALANGNSGAADFVRPGHVFPLVAKDGGVLMRSGHTEACVDLCRLAGLPPVGVICRTDERRRHGDARAGGRGLRREAQAQRRFRSPISSPTARRATSWSSASANSRCKSRDRHAHRLRLCDAVRRRAAHGLRPRPHRRRQERAGAAASRRHHPRRVRRRQHGARGAARASSARAAACWSFCATARPACRHTPFRRPARAPRRPRARGSGARSASARRS